MRDFALLCPHFFDFKIFLSLSFKSSGSVKVLLRWNFPGHDGDAVATGYQIFVNQRQYGGDLTVHTTNAVIEVILTIYFL